MLDRSNELTATQDENRSASIPGLGTMEEQSSEPDVRRPLSTARPFDFHPFPDFAAAFALDPQVVRWTMHPRAVLGRLMGAGVVLHVPDLEVEFLDGSVCVADADGIVGFDPLDPAVRYVDAAVERPLDAATRRNLRRIVEHVGVAFTREDLSRVIEHLRQAEEATLVEVAAVIEDSTDPICTVVAMAAQRMIDLDWQNGPINATSMIRPRAAPLREELLGADRPEPDA